MEATTTKANANTSGPGVLVLPEGVTTHNLNAQRGLPMYYNKASVGGTKFRVQIANDKPVQVGEICLLGINGYKIVEIETKRPAKGDWGDTQPPDFYSLICDIIRPTPLPQK